MRAAIYARRSTDDHQQASLEVQLEEARRYIASKGWTLEEREHVFIDDAISRAEFVKRPELHRVLAAAEARTIDVVVTRDETRIGGDMLRTGLWISELKDAGARLFYYFADEEVLSENPTQRLVLAVKNYSAELERDKISQRTYEHLMTKARRGLNAGAGATATTTSR